MKIAFVDFVLDPARPGASGLSDIVWNMGRHLVELGHEVHVVAPYTVETFPAGGIHVHRFALPPIGYRNILGHFWIVLRADQELKKIPDLDIIHAPEYFSTGVLSALGQTVPLVLTVPGNIYERIKRGNPYDFVTTQAYKLAAMQSAHGCSAVIAISAEMAWWWSYTGTPAGTLHTIPLGVNSAQFQAVPDSRAIIGLPEQGKIVVYAGRMSHEKGLNFLLDAVKELAVRHDDLWLCVVGDGSLREEFLQSVDRAGLAGRFIHRPWVPASEMPRYYSAATVYVLPSLSEGMPRVMVEAMACGAPFLGTRISGIEDHVVDGETGFLVPPADAAALAGKLEAILSDPVLAQTVAAKGRDYVRTQLDWAVITKRIATEVYEPIVERRHGVA